MKLTCLALLLLYGTHCVLSARILAVLPLPGKSHFIYSQAVLSALAARGHQVTVYSPFTPPKPVPNMKHLEIHTNREKEMLKGWTFDSFMQFIMSSPFVGGGCFPIWNISYAICEEYLSHPEIHRLILSNEKFDVVITEALFGQESMLVLGHFFKAPTINLNGFGPWSVINEVHGNPLQIATAPDVVSFPFTDRMTYMERFRNLLSTIRTMVYYYVDHLIQHEDIIQKVFRDMSVGTPRMEQLLNNLSVTLANFHPTVGYPQSYPGNIVPLGGIHIATDPAPLPKDIKEFMDSGKNSVIYFSLGTVIPVHLMPAEYLQAFVKVFSKLPYKVLWKIDTDKVPNLPKNVMISKWLPQQSVLAHPNCVLFITHGGLLSQQEAFHAGVPVVGIPFFGDQPYNVRLYEHLGVGVKLDFATLTEESMTKAILSVVGKPQFIENAKKVSVRFRHRAMSPADAAVYWVEYVIRHNGAHHLKPYAAQMAWYQLALLDVLGVVIVVLILAILLFYKILSLLLGCCTKKTPPKKQTSSKKKTS